MTTRMHAVPSASIVGRTVLALIVASASFIAGAMFQGPRWSYDTSAAFAQPAGAAQPEWRTPTPATGIFSPARADEYDGDQIFEPRECDLPEGVSTACLFMD